MARNQQLTESINCSNFVETIKRFENNNLAYWQIGDEPRSRSEIDNWGNCSDTIFKYDKNHLIMANLLPLINEDAKVDFKDTIINSVRIPGYEVYLNYVKEKLKPAVWSVDYYPIRAKYIKENGKYVEIDSFNDYFYKLMKRFADLAAETQRPFWFYVLSSGDFKSYDVDYNIPNPTDGSIRLLANAALAYGAKGLAYWTYCQRSRSEFQDLINSAPVDLENDTTKIWDYVRAENEFIRRYEFIFLNSEFVDCCFTGASIPEGNKRISDSGFGPIQKLESEATGVLISILKQGNMNFLMIVNRDYKNKQQIDITFKENNSIQKIISFEKEEVYNSSARISPINRMTLTPGEMYIFPYFE